MSLRRLSVSVFTLLLLQGCASIGRDECQVADWYTVGLEDGARGAAPDAIARYRKACAEHGVTPDLNAYMSGRAEGLASFCTPGSGFNVGAQGGAYAGVCPPELESAFLEAYGSGRKLYELEVAANEAEYRLASAQDELAHVRKTIAGKQAALVAGEATTEERLQMALDIRDLARREEELARGLGGLEREVEKRNKQLAKYRSRVAYNP
jgi:hypothetical protein